MNDDKVVILVVEQTPANVVSVEGGTTVISTVDSPSILYASEQGPVGPEGKPGPAAGTAFTRPAAANVSGGKAVTLNAAGQVLHANGANAAMAHSVAGISLNGGAAGADITIITTGGEIEESVWNWQANKPVFLGADGVLTQTAPTSGYLLVVGVAVGPTRMLVKVQQPIFIA